MSIDAGLKQFLEEKVRQFNTPEFIPGDPISIPHRFSMKEDIEISGLLTACISWGSRISILKSADRMMNIMGNSPYDFVMNHKEHHLKKAEGFVHRTFNSTDLMVFLDALKRMYLNYGGLEGIFLEYRNQETLQPAIHHFKKVFFNAEYPPRTRKHLPDPLAGSAAKRINMFLRWMVRKDPCGVDFGIWDQISPSKLSIPLDIHSGQVARKLGLLSRKQDDARAVAELDAILRILDKDDPVKYDFALFGMGIAEKGGI